jgi:hypothetical protein
VTETNATLGLVGFVFVKLFLNSSTCEGSGNSVLIVSTGTCNTRDGGGTSNAFVVKRDSSPIIILDNSYMGGECTTLASSSEIVSVSEIDGCSPSDSSPTVSTLAAFSPELPELITYFGPGALKGYEDVHLFCIIPFFV